MIRSGAGLAVLFVWTTAASAAPTVVSDDDLRWQIDLPPSWSPADREDLQSGKSLGVWTSGRRRLVVFRLRGNTDGAYEGRPGFFAGLEEGAKKETPDFHRLSGTVRKIGKTKKIPVYDLWYRGADALRGVRFIFLKNYCLMGTVELPGEKTIPKDVRRLLETLGPGN